MLNGLRIKAASVQILAGIRPFRPSQAFLKKRCRAHVNVEQRHSSLSVARLGWAGERNLRHRHALLLRDQPNGLRKRDVLDLLHEGEDISRLPAAKTVKELPRSMHGERRRLLGMKRT